MHIKDTRLLSDYNLSKVDGLQVTLSKLCAASRALPIPGLDACRDALLAKPAALPALPLLRGELITWKDFLALGTRQGPLLLHPAGRGQDERPCEKHRETRRGCLVRLQNAPGVFASILQGCLHGSQFR